MASILILVPALCIAIVYIIYVLRHSYKPEPIRFVEVVVVGVQFTKVTSGI